MRKFYCILLSKTATEVMLCSTISVHHSQYLFLRGVLHMSWAAWLLSWHCYTITKQVGHNGNRPPGNIFQESKY